MAKFDLKKERLKTKQEAILSGGYHRMTITQIVELGLQRFNRDEEGKQSLGLCFQSADGLQVAKIITLSLNGRSNLTQMLAACDEVEELEELLGKQLDLEIESNGKYPRITGYYHVDEGLSGQPALSGCDTVYYTIDHPDPETLKKLHRDLRQAVSGRVRNKE